MQIVMVVDCDQIIGVATITGGTQWCRGEYRRNNNNTEYETRINNMDMVFVVDVAGRMIVFNRLKLSTDEVYRGKLYTV